MSKVVFDTKFVQPTNEELNTTLNDTARVWQQLIKTVYEMDDTIKEEWKFYSKKSGWVLLLKQKKRTLFYLIPTVDYFEVLFVFGERAVAASQNTNLPFAIRSEIENAVAYREGRSFRAIVKNVSDLDDVFTLLHIKIEN